MMTYRSNDYYAVAMRKYRFKKKLRQAHPEWSDVRLAEEVMKHKDKWEGKELVASYKKNNGTTANANVSEDIREDTRELSWEEWTERFLCKRLLDHQVVNLNYLDSERVVLCDPRQHGKTTFVVQPFIVRKIVENVFEEEDKPVLYITSTMNRAKRMGMAIRWLLEKKTITDYYGEVIEDDEDRARLTQNELSVKWRRDPNLLSFFTTSVGAAIRGENFYYVIVDDPIDLKKESKTAKATEDFMLWLNNKIIPIVKGNIAIIGTRYDVDDIYVRLKETRSYRYVQRSAINKIPPFVVPEREVITPKDLIIAAEEEDYQLLAPWLWRTRSDTVMFNGTPLQNLMDRLREIGEFSFKQEYMNDPIADNIGVDFSRLISYEVLPCKSTDMKWSIFVDPAAGETKGSDYTAMVLVGSYNNRYYIHDMIYGRWTGGEQLNQLIAFHDCAVRELSLNKKMLTVGIETVMNQRTLYQRVRDETNVTCRAVSPASRGEKKRRIIYGFVQHVENGVVYINGGCRNKRQLRFEMSIFPTGNDDHLIDAIDQAIDLLRGTIYSRIDLSSLNKWN